MMYQPGMLPIPTISTFLPLSILLSNGYCGPGPYQQPVNSVITGLLTGPLFVGSGVGVSVKLEVAVAVGGRAVDVGALAVWVDISETNCWARVPTISTGGGVDLGAHAENMRIEENAVVTRHSQRSFLVRCIHHLLWFADNVEPLCI